MADHSRPASFLPTIKCSSCSQEIEIAMMGEHVCLPASSLFSESEAKGQTEASASSSRRQEYGGSDFLKPSRREPPRINAAAANKPFFEREQTFNAPLTATFNDRQNDSYHDTQISRSASIDAYSSNEKLPSFPLSSSEPRLNSFKTHGERKRENFGLDESNPLYAPASPSIIGGGNVLKRMNTIKPGPFDLRANQTSRETTKRREVGHQRNTTAASTSSSGSNRSTLNRKVSDANPMFKRSQTDRVGDYSRTESSTDRFEDKLDRSKIGEAKRSQTFPLLREDAPVDKPSSSGLPLRPSKASDAKNNTLFPDDYMIGNPYHTSSASQSSNGSYGSEVKTNSSRSSPPLSEASSSMGSRKPLKVSNLDNLMDNIQGSIKSPLPAKELPSTSSRNEKRPWADKTNLESPMDPAMKGNFIVKDSPLASPAFPPPKMLPQQRLAPLPSKGACRGCGEQIRGKSVSSSDGRLTGKYHKECFVCKSCRVPFETSEFYILNNHPYCERHYHKLNNSLCQACDQGIEGQYLETDKKQKFHPKCLTCRECRQVLRDDYFELNDKIYCERHATHIAQQSSHLAPPGMNFKPERRMTRLMTMTTMI